MSIEGQPNTILTVYSPFAWVEELTATNTGTFINYPTAQNAPISFPNTITANKVESSSITTIDNAPLSIGTFVGRTRAINIGTGMSAGIISLGGVATTVKLNSLSSDSTLAIQNSDGLGIGAVSLGIGETRTGNIEIGSNTTNTVGLSTGNVNIMCGTGRQEGSFNVLTNSANTGNIVLGNTTAGNITINAKLASGIPILQNVAFPTNNTTYLLGTDVANITTATIVADQNNQYVGRFVPFIAGTGKMLMTAVITFSASQLTPYLHFRAYRRATTISINTTVVPGTDTELTGIKWIQRYYTTTTGDIMTAILTGTYTSNPLLNTTANAIGFAVQNLTASPSTLTLSTVNCYVTVYRIG